MSVLFSFLPQKTSIIDSDLMKENRLKQNRFGPVTADTSDATGNHSGSFFVQKLMLFSGY